MPEPTIRRAILGDLSAILALYRQLNPDDPVLDAVAAETSWSVLLSNSSTIPVVAEIGGMPLSTCTLAIVPNLTRGARPYGVIENVVTDVDHRRMGLGKAVLRVALETAWEANCYKVLLATGSRKESTLRFFNEAGFERGGKTYFEARRSKTP